MSNISSDEFNRILQEMRSNYIDELPSRVEEVERAILDAKSSMDYKNTYESLYRNVHSIKGSAGTHGLHLISTICHNLEDRITEFGEVQENITDDQINSCLALVDLLSRTIVSYAAYEEDFSSIEKELEVLRHKEAGIQYTALIVEASSIHKQMVEQVFGGMGFNFSRCENGYDALGRLLSEPFDMLITGKQIPRLDGIALIGALRLSKSLNSKIATILMTSDRKHEYTRQTDPDFVVYKDSSMITQLAGLAKDIEFVLNSKNDENETRH